LLSYSVINPVKLPISSIAYKLLFWTQPIIAGFELRWHSSTVARTLFTQKDGMGPSALSFWAARSEFIAKNRAALVDFLEDAVRSTRWYKDPANRKEAVEIVAKAIKQPPERIAPWLFSDNDDFYRDPNLTINLSALQSNVDLLGADRPQS
jgi:NitT/TauT family transport system substrate-binding protein